MVDCRWPIATDSSKSISGDTVTGKTFSMFSAITSTYNACKYNGVISDDTYFDAAQYYRCLFIKSWAKKIDGDTTKAKFYDYTTGAYKNVQPIYSTAKLCTFIDSDLGSDNVKSNIYFWIFDSVIFSNVEFTNITFFDTAFTNCAFIDCTFTNCVFDGDTCIDKSSFSGCDFISIKQKSNHPLITNSTFRPHTILGCMVNHCSPYEPAWAGYYAQKVMDNLIYEGIPQNFTCRECNTAGLTFSMVPIAHKATSIYSGYTEVTQPAIKLSKKPVLFSSAGL